MEIRLRLMIGRPNAAKSTLLNRLVGTKIAIVSDKPQDHEDAHSRRAELPGRAGVYLDTPGSTGRWHRMNVRVVDTAIGDDSRGGRWFVSSSTSMEPPGKGDRSCSHLSSNASAPVF